MSERVETLYCTIERDELKRLREDAGRLDFMERLVVKVYGNINAGGFAGPKGREFEVYVRTHLGPNFSADGETLRQAIDAALLAAQGERHE